MVAGVIVLVALHRVSAASGDQRVLLVECSFPQQAAGVVVLPEQRGVAVGHAHGVAAHVVVTHRGHQLLAIIAIHRPMGAAGDMGIRIAVGIQIGFLHQQVVVRPAIGHPAAVAAAGALAGVPVLIEVSLADGGLLRVGTGVFELGVGVLKLLVAGEVPVDVHVIGPHDLAVLIALVVNAGVASLAGNGLQIRAEVLFGHDQIGIDHIAIILVALSHGAMVIHPLDAGPAILVHGQLIRRIIIGDAIIVVLAGILELLLGDRIAGHGTFAVSAVIGLEVDLAAVAVILLGHLGIAAKHLDELAVHAQVIDLNHALAGVVSVHHRGIAGMAQDGLQVDAIVVRACQAARLVVGVLLAMPAIRAQHARATDAVDLPAQQAARFVIGADDGRAALFAGQQIALSIEVALGHRPAVHVIQDLRITAGRPGQAAVLIKILGGENLVAVPAIATIAVAAGDCRTRSRCVVAVLGQDVIDTLAIPVVGVLGGSITRVRNYRFTVQAEECLGEQVAPLVPAVRRSVETAAVQRRRAVQCVRSLLHQPAVVVPHAFILRELGHRQRVLPRGHCGSGKNHSQEKDQKRSQAFDLNRHFHHPRLSFSCSDFSASISCGYRIYCSSLCSTSCRSSSCPGGGFRRRTRNPGSPCRSVPPP